MIASTIATDNNNGWVMSFGWLAAASMITLIVANTVRPRVTTEHETLAERIEQRVGELVDSGADEKQLRDLIGDAVRFGRTRSDQTA
jgi:Na+(H+)/acetate symporter ActP